MQPTHIVANQSNQCRLLERCSTPKRQNHHEVLISQPGNTKRAYEMATQRIAKHDPQANSAHPTGPPVPSSGPKHPWTTHTGLIPDDEDSKDRPALITDVEDESIANIFCFRAFSDKRPVSCITTALVTFPSCPWMAMSVFCYVSLQNQRHLCHTYTWT